MALPPFLRPTTPFSVADRRVLFLVGIIAFVTGYAANQMAHTLPWARESLDRTEGEMSMLWAIVHAVSLLGLLFSLAADRRGRKRPLLLAFVLLVFGNVFTAFVPTVIGYTVSQSLVRIAVVAVASLGIVLVAEELTPAIRGYGLGLYGLAGALGVGTGLLLLSVADRSDDAWRILFALTGLGILAFPLLNRFLPESRAFRPGPAIPFHRALGMGLGRHFWPLAGVSFFVAMFSSTAFRFATERLISDLGWETAAAIFLLIAASGAGAVGLLVGGRTADRIGRRPTAISALVLGLLGGLGFYFLQSGWLLAAAIFVASFGATMLTPSLGAFRAELFPTRVRAAAGAWTSNAAIVGAILGFVVGGALIDSIGLPSTIAVLSIGVVIAIGLTLLLPETRGIDLVRTRRAHRPPETPAAAPDDTAPPSATSAPSPEAAGTEG